MTEEPKDTITTSNVSSSSASASVSADIGSDLFLLALLGLGIYAISQSGGEEEGDFEKNSLAKKSEK